MAECFSDDTEFVGCVGGDLIRQGIWSGAQEEFVDKSRPRAAGTEHRCRDCGHTFAVEISPA